MARTDRPDRHGFLLYGKAEDGLCGLAAMPDVARAPLRLFLTDRKAAPVFAIGPREKLASSSCVRPFRPLLHEAATGAALARILLWSPDLQPHPPPPHICALTAEDILIEHSSNATGADCCGYRDGTAFSAVAPRERPACSTVRAPE